MQYVRQILELAIEIRIISLRAFFELDKCCKIKMAKGTILSGNTSYDIVLARQLRRK